MAIDRARVLTDLSDMLAAISADSCPGKQITRQTKLVGDLGLPSTGIANLAGRVKSHFGPTANLLPFFTSCNFFSSANAGPLRDLQVGELAEYLAGLLCVEQVNRAAAMTVASVAAGTPFVPPAPEEPGTVIIGSGRCGSTMLSRFIADEPRTLSVSESLVLQLRAALNRDPDVEMSGGEYWALLSTPPRDPRPGGKLARRPGWFPVQFSYPDTGRYAGDWSSVPPILQITLPQLTDDPDRLFDQLGELVPRFPPRPALDLHKMLLDLIANLAGKRRWVERTGGASDVAAPLLRTFRDARIVYLTRDIADTALSMSKHPAFQMTAARDDLRTRDGVGPLAPRPAGPAEPPHRITWQTLREVGRDVARFECMAAHMNGCAEQALIDAQPRHLHRVRYENIVDHPAEELTGLGEFLGFADPARWAARVAHQVRRT